jgi:hypothetical protein
LVLVLEALQQADESLLGIAEELRESRHGDLAAGIVIGLRAVRRQGAALESYLTPA